MLYTVTQLPVHSRIANNQIISTDDEHTKMTKDFLSALSLASDQHFRPWARVTVIRLYFKHMREGYEGNERRIIMHQSIINHHLTNQSWGSGLRCGNL